MPSVSPARPAVKSLRQRDSLGQTGPVETSNLLLPQLPKVILGRHDRHLAVLPLGRRGPGAVFDLGVAGDGVATVDHVDELGEMNMKTVSRTMLVLPLLFLGTFVMANDTPKVLLSSTMTKALLVIDLQNDYFPGGKFPLWNTDAVLQNIEQAIERAKAKAFPSSSSSTSPTADGNRAVLQSGDDGRRGPPTHPRRCPKPPSS